MTSATERLRALLDERGVEHFDATECTLWGYEQTSDSTGCYRCAADEVGEGFMTLRMHHITPEQAIAATLGSCNCSNNCTNGERTETCKLDDFADVPFSVDYEIEGYDMDSGRDYATLAECSACGAYIIVPPEYHHVLTCDGDEVYQPYRFCPNCGRRIEQ